MTARTALRHLHRKALLRQQRNLHGLQVVARGPGGRSSDSGIIATVFGATGFLARYLVNELGRIGSQIVVPYRGDEHDWRHLKVMGDVGQIVAVPFRARDRESVERVVSKSNAVFNLIGYPHETRNFSFEDVNVNIARTIAEVCADKRIERFVHVSATAADEDSPSEWARTKALGERAVRSAFPAATIVRPTVLVGSEDRFFNDMAMFFKLFRFVPIVEGGTARLQPVFVRDVARGIMATLSADDAPGKTYDFGGPEVHTYNELVSFMFEKIEHQSRTVHIPKSILKSGARVLEFAPYPQLTRDKVELLTCDRVVAPNAANTLQTLGIEPTSMDEACSEYLSRFQSKGGTGFLNVA